VSDHHAPNPAPSESSQTTEERALRQARNLINLLGRPATGVFQCEDGSYRGKRHTIGVPALTKHFLGVETIAVRVINDGVGRTIVIDIDKDFPRRLSILAAILRERGLGAAAICTSGSDAGRGKLLVFFGQYRKQHELRATAQSILQKAQADYLWGDTGASDASVFPNEGAEGGVVRIGGINRKSERRASSVDSFFSVEGEPVELSAVLPFAENEIIASGIAAWAQRETSSAWTWGSKTFGRAMRLCLEARRCFGATIGKHRVETWSERIWKQSPQLQQPKSDSNSRARRGWDRCWERAWDYACKRHNTIRQTIESYTLSNPGAPSLDERQDNVRVLSGTQRKIMGVLWTYALEKGLSPCAIGISYRQIAAYSGVSLMTAHTQVQRLEAAGYVVIHDRGTNGPKGQKTIIGIVEANETPSATRKKAASRGNVKRRVEFRSRRKTAQRNTAQFICRR
jgi:hypothetical protein